MQGKNRQRTVPHGVEMTDGQSLTTANAEEHPASPELRAVRAAWGSARCLVLADVEPRFAGQVDLERLARIAAAVLAAESLTGDSEISLVITDDATIRRLNAAARGVDRPTDVLAYPQVLPGEEPVPTPDGVRRLGDIVISFERAAAQAAELGHSIDRELDVLMAHGVLHLRGHTDDRPEDKAAMLARGDAILALLDG